MDAKHAYNPLNLTTQDLERNEYNDILECVDDQYYVSINDISTGMNEDYMEEVNKAVERGKKFTDKDFIVEVIRSLIKTQRKAIRTQVHFLVVMPTPKPGRAYFRYHAASGDLEFLWDLPVRKACTRYYNSRMNAEFFGPVLNAVLDYKDGTLTKKADAINDELRKQYAKQ